VCQNNICTMGRCLDGYDDCDLSDRNGCEVSLLVKC
jgi:hypothetical protein